MIKKCRPVKAMPDGWSAWQKPTMQGYKIQCCDCDLIHEVDFRVVKIVEIKRNGWKVVEAAGDEYEVELRMRRA